MYMVKGQINMVIAAALIAAVGFAMPIHLAVDHAAAEHDHALNHRHEHTPDAPHIEAVGHCETQSSCSESDTHSECCPEDSHPDHSEDDHQVMLKRNRVLDDALIAFVVASFVVDADAAPSLVVWTDTGSPPIAPDRTPITLRGPPTA